MITKSHDHKDAILLRFIAALSHTYIRNSPDDYERVSTSLDSSLSNIGDATKESVDTIVKSLNDLLLTPWLRNRKSVP